MALKKIVIDVLLPHEPDIMTYAERITASDETMAITLNVLEVDENTKTVQITIEGEALSFERIRETIEDLGGSIHSVDSVSAGSKIV